MHIFLLESNFFLLSSLPRHACSYAVSLTQKPSDVSLFGRAQLAKGYAWPGWTHIGPQHQASARNQESESAWLRKDRMLDQAEPTTGGIWAPCPRGWAGWQVARRQVSRSERTREQRRVVRGSRLGWDVRGPTSTSQWRVRLTSYTLSTRSSPSACCTHVVCMQPASLIEHHTLRCITAVSVVCRYVGLIVMSLFSRLWLSDRSGHVWVWCNSCWVCTEEQSHPPWKRSRSVCPLYPSGP